MKLSYQEKFVLYAFFIAILFMSVLFFGLVKEMIFTIHKYQEEMDLRVKRIEDQLNFQGTVQEFKREFCK